MISKGLLDKYGKVNAKTPADYAKTALDVRYVVIVSYPGTVTDDQVSPNHCLESAEALWDSFFFQLLS